MAKAEKRLKIKMNWCELSLLPVIDLNSRGGQHKVQGLQEFRANMSEQYAAHHIVESCWLIHSFPFGAKALRTGFAAGASSLSCDVSKHRKSIY